jgi:competence protein ComEA
MTEEADTNALNQAEPVVDGQKVYVPIKGEEVSNSSSGKGKVNINTAGESELMTLPGIGESKAKAIISYRKESGGFKSIEDIMNIPGIKTSAFSKIKEYICV